MPDPEPSSTPTPPEAAAAPALGVPVLAITMLAITAMASGMSMRLADALLPRLAQEFGVSLGQAAQVITTFSVAYGLSQGLFGPLGDRFGKYRVIAWAAAASALTTLACALAPGQAALLLARTLAGASAGAVIPLAMAWIGDVVPYEQRQAVLARFLMGQMSGVALGVWLGGVTADHLPWRTPFFGIAAFFGLAAVVLLVVQRRLPHSARAGAVGAAGGGRPGMAAEFAAVLRLRWARVVLAAVCMEGALFYGPFAFIAAHLHRHLGLPLASAGAVVMLFAGGGMAFALNARWLVQRLGETLLVRTGAALAATAMGVLALAPGVPAAMAACAAMGLGFYMLHNTLQTHATQMAPERRGAAVAAFACCFFLGQSAGVALCGAAVGVVDTGWLLAAGALGLLAVAAGFSGARRPPAPPARPVAAG